MTSLTNDNILDQDPIEITGSEAVCRSLIAEGVDIIFGYPGGAIMPIYDALHDHHQQLKHVLTRHEQGAVHAAQGYARVSGKVGVCLATSGPGATNLITGIADALIDSTPLVCITGQVVSGLLGTDAFSGIGCDRYHDAGNQMELPDYLCGRDSGSDIQGILYCINRASGSGGFGYHQRCPVCKG